MLETYIWRIDEVVESISDFGVSYNKVTVSLKRIGEIINNNLYDDEKFGSTQLDDCKGYIEFKNVKFRYTEKEDYTFLYSHHRALRSIDRRIDLRTVHKREQSKHRRYRR